jgi:hypothetical protein
MNVTILREAGYTEALLGLSLSYDQDPANMPAVADRLATRDDGHNKFLESIVVWLDITAPRYWWQETATYRVPQDGEDGFQPSGITTQSASTMHTLLRRELTPGDFEYGCHSTILDLLNEGIQSHNLVWVKAHLPEGFLQRRIVCTNYKALRHIVSQRANHKLREWRIFCVALRGLEHAAWVLTP